MAAPRQRDVNGFTPTQARIMAVLADGTWHPKRELLAAIDEMAEDNLLYQHMFDIRKIIEPRREVISTCTHPTMGTLYMLSRHLAPMING